MNEQTSSQQFSNETISVQCTNRPGCLIEMIVTVGPTGCQAVQQKALKEVRKEASLPGFRQGHVPEQVVLKHFKPQLIRRTQSMIMSTAFDDAVRLIGRNPFSKNSLRKANLQKSSKEQGAELFFLFEAAPKIPSIVFEDLRLTQVDPKPVQDEELNERCLWWRFQAKKLEPVENRPCQESDVAKVELKDSTTGAVEERTVYVRSKLPRWLFDALVGTSVGETKEIVIPAEGETSAQTRQLTVKSLQSCIIPDETDEFAKTMGETSVESFRQKMHLRLEFEAQMAAHERMRRQVRNELIRLYAFDLPQSLIEKETDFRFQAFWKHLPQEQKDAANKETLRKPFLDEVKRHFTCLMLLEPLFETVNPTYTSQQLSNEYFQQIQLPPERRVYFDALSEEEVVQRLLMEIAMRQCEDYCIEQRLGIHAPSVSHEELPSSTCECETGSPYACKADAACTCEAGSACSCGTEEDGCHCHGH